MNRRRFLQRGALAGGGWLALGALSLRGLGAASAPGYGALVPKSAQNDPTMRLRLPAAFHFEVVSRQGVPMSDGRPTPGLFDGTGAFPTGREDTTILIRNHENRRLAGEIPVVVPRELRYDSDPAYIGGDTKLLVRRTRTGTHPDGSPRYSFTVLRDFAILGGTDTNCAGGVIGKSWYSCEEAVSRSARSGRKHGYVFAVDAYAEGPVQASPLQGLGRFAHEALAELDGFLYETEDRVLSPDPVAGTIGAVLYRHARGRLQGLKLREEWRANMDLGRVVGRPYPVEWVEVEAPDHDDDTDERRDRVRGATPTRIQAIDRGAAFFNRLEGIWSAPGSGKLYFDTTAGGAAGLGQVWEYDARRESVTLLYESRSAAQLEGPDNVVLVPRTGDLFVQEDAGGPQFIRGLTPGGALYDFCETMTNATELCGGCFDAGGLTLFVSQQGTRSGADLEGGPATRAVTYAIYGPFEKRLA